MPITLNCPKCQKPFRVRDESIGGRVRCPSCAAILQVPSSLAPASHFGFDPPGGAPQNPSEMTGAHRPMADDVAPTPLSDQDLMLGGAGRPPMMEFGAAGTALPSPPSIKFRGLPGAPSPGIPTAPVPYTSGSKMERPSSFAGGPALNLPKPASSFILPPTPGPATQLPGTSTGSGWTGACRGLSLVQGGLILWMVPFLGALGHIIWAYLKPEQAAADAPGFLGRAELPFWKELALAYTVPAVCFGLLLLFLGRVKCNAVPDPSAARGLARAATFCTLLGVVGAGAAAAYYFGYAEKFKLPPEAGPLGLCVWAPAAVLADLFTLFFIAQVGWAAGRPKLLLSVGTFLTFVLVAPAMMAAATLFFPAVEPLRVTLDQYGNPFANPDKQVTQRLMIAGGIVALYGATLFACYAGLAAAAKRAIRNQFGT